MIEKLVREFKQKVSNSQELFEKYLERFKEGDFNFILEGHKFDYDKIRNKTFAGIDGSMSYFSEFGLGFVITNAVSFLWRDGNVKRDENVSVVAGKAIWEDDIPDGYDASEVSSNLAKSLMTMLETFVLSKQVDKVDVVFFDRPLSTLFHSLYWFIRRAIAELEENGFVEDEVVLRARKLLQTFFTSQMPKIPSEDAEFFKELFIKREEDKPEEVRVPQFDDIRKLFLSIHCATLCFFASALETALRKNKLIIGIGKDTKATDILRNFVGDEKFGGISDRFFLSSLSSVRGFKIPWRTMGYDFAFSLMQRYDSRRWRLFSGKEESFKISGRFVRLYLQTTEFSDGTRSPVFICDRPFYKEEDESFLKTIELENGAEISVYSEEGGRSDISDELLIYVSAFEQNSISEAVGHNYLLFLADKWVKSEISQLASSLEKITRLQAQSIASDNKLFFIYTSFRELRARFETSRRTSR